MKKMTNTLFRFATMRSPELIEEESKEKFFVYHPNPSNEGHFKSLVASPIADAALRNQTWRNLANSFGAFQSPAQVKAFLGDDFFDFANWLARNAKAVSNDGSLVTSQQRYRDQIPLTHGQEIILWDNLLYQLITNNSAYVRDLVINVLIANHYLNAAPLADQSKTALSRVVIPQEFYGTVSMPASLPNNEPVYTRPLQQQLEKVLAAEKSTQLNALAEDFKKAQDSYTKKNAALYEQARAAYEAEALRRIRSNDLFNTDEARILPEGAEDIGTFEFTPAAEVVPSEITGFLSVQSQQLANELDLFSKSSFAEIFSAIKEALQLQTDVSFPEDQLSNRVVGINNVLLPVTEGLTQNGQQYAYTMQVVPVGNNLNKVVVVINMGYPNADAVYALYHAETSQGNNTNGAFIDYGASNYLVVQLYPNGFSLPANTLTFRLHGEIRLANGDTLRFDTPVSVKDGATGRMTLAGEEVPQEGEDYVPLGFGIKRLGIADYRRVEQTVCCYVPGEVSHIENIMAKEYKEKSTRRLRRSEDTTTIEKTTEKEDLTDTTSTNRFEMNQQVAEVINKDFSSNISSSTNFKMFGTAETTLNTNFAFNTSSQHSNSQAVTIAKDVTERAMERVVQKVREERILKIVEEFEEQNKHGFDNRKGDKHVSGVYRWIDKIYKNQIFNYGKRLMYEFMIPQPAVFHNEAMKNIVSSNNGTVLEKPVDPRTAGLIDYRNVTEASAAKWAAAYGAEIETLSDESLRVSKAFHLSSGTAGEFAANSEKLEVPEGYKAVSATLNYCFYYHPNRKEFPHVMITVGDKRAPFAANSELLTNIHNIYFDSPIQNEVAVGVEVGDLAAISYTVTLNCIRTDQNYRQWQISCFDSILKGYEKKLAAYNDAVASMNVDAGSKGTNPGFYRLIENTVLRKNCITYLVGPGNLGKKYYSGSTTSSLQPEISENMDRYAARVKFMEQAFEWDLMSYSFYPFYWGDKSAWQNLYQAEVNDPLFRSFLQAGMARAVVTVRPGFEEAVMHYMATGQIWNGGQVPVIGDDMYLSIVEELKNPEYYVEETWETRVPTTLNVIQAGSIGLNAQGLPCSCGETETEITQQDVIMLGEGDIGGHGTIPVDYPMSPLNQVAE